MHSLWTKLTTLKLGRKKLQGNWVYLMENYLLLIQGIVYWGLPLCQTLYVELLAQALNPELRHKRGNWQADPPTFDSALSSVKTLRKGIWLSINWRTRLILDVSPKKIKLQIIYMRITIIAIPKEAAITSCVHNSRGHHAQGNQYK